ncbi:MAG: exonuclease domain-containing protein [Saprospiraceae bacterium]
MQFNLDRDLVFFDVESTGLNVIRDRILQIGLVKFSKKGGEPEELEMLINPGIPISEEAMGVHGITPKMLKNKPTFQQVAQQLLDFIGNADLAGYNSNRYDVPMLMEEFARVGIEFSTKRRRLIDVQRIFYKMEPRTLSAALKFYCGKEIENAHDALADVHATIDVLKGQLERYKEEDFKDSDGNIITAPIQNDMQAIHDFTNDMRFLDATQKMKLDANGVAVFAFGKHNNKPVGETCYRDRNYYNWILNKEFSSQVKQLVKEYFKEYERSQRG